MCEKGPSVSAESTAKKNTLSSREGKGVVNKGSLNQSSSPRKYDPLLVRFSDSWIILLSPAFPPSPATAVAYSGRFRPHLQLRGSDGFAPSFLCGALCHRQDYDLSEGIPNVNGFFSIQIRAYGNMPVVKEEMVSKHTIEQKIYLLRGQKVMLDKDLAKLYGIETKMLKQAVKRNIKRFPADFMFVLIKHEFNNLRSQFVTSSWGGMRYVPMAFSHSLDLGLATMMKQAGRKAKGYKHYQINLAVKNFLTPPCLIASKVECPDTAGYIL